MSGADSVEFYGNRLFIQTARHAITKKLTLVVAITARLAGVPGPVAHRRRGEGMMRGGGVDTSTRVTDCGDEVSCECIA